MMHPKMLRRILTFASNKLNENERYGFFVYFEQLKLMNDRLSIDHKRKLEELLLDALSLYFP